MMPITLLSQLLFSPQLVEPKAAFQQNSKNMWIGLVAGIVGLGIQVMWLSPDDFIGFGWRFEPSLLVNKIVGFSIGAILIVILYLFEGAFLSMCKVKGVSGAIKGSIATLLLVPLVAIPLHSLFPDGVTNSGHVELFFILCGLFLTYHIAVLGTLLAKGHCISREQRPVPSSTVIKLVVLLLAVEVLLTIVFLAVFPFAFRLTAEEFIREWV
nr:hypothetical protein [Candidatus Sigynarchaeota archaeon]